jgi:signal transduction histidine kinase
MTGAVLTGNRGWRAYLPDVALAGAIGVLLVIHGVIGRAVVPPAAVDYLLIAVGVVAAAACRRMPVVGLLVTTAAMAAYTLRVHPGPPGALAVLGAVYVAANAGHRLLAALASGGFLASFFAADLAVAAQGSVQPDPERTMLLLGWFLAANVAGAVSRGRRAYLRQVEERAAEAERTREETALRRAGEERLRIARELHDSLTHSISIIKVQAGVAVHLAHKRGEEVPAALLAIQEASGEAMRELRSTLEVLREPDGRDLDRLSDLVERTGSASLRTTLTVDGRPRPLPVEVDRAAYRIVQEALTNVSRHAGPAKAVVRLDYRPDQLVISVDDDGRGARDDMAAGVGLTGMRERVTALGGTLRVGPRDGGGFGVRAELPLEAPKGVAAGGAEPATRVEAGP